MSSEQMDVDIVEVPNQLVDGLPAESKAEKQLQEDMDKID